MSSSSEAAEMPDYVSTKQAAEILGVSTHRMYQYVNAKRIPVIRIGKAFMIPRQAIEQFKPNPSGRTRTKAPAWRTYHSKGGIFVSTIQVSVRSGQQEMLIERMTQLQRDNKHTFPGTIARYVVKGDELFSTVDVLLIWKETEMPDEEIRQRDLDAFKRELADVLDWDTAYYSTNEAIIHT